MLEWLMALDTRIFLFLNGLHNEHWDVIMWWISGKTTWWPFYTLLLLFLAWKKKWQLAPMLLFVVLSVVITDQTSVHWFKFVFERSRPCHEPSLEGMVHVVNNKCGGSFGFISSHAANTAGIAALLLFWIRKAWFSTVMVFWAVLVSYSRIYLGVHYPGDVIGGFIWGFAWGSLLLLLFNRMIRKLPDHWWITNT